MVKSTTYFGQMSTLRMSLRKVIMFTKNINEYTCSFLVSPAILFEQKTSPFKQTNLYLIHFLSINRPILCFLIAKFCPPKTSVFPTSFLLLSLRKTLPVCYPKPWNSGPFVSRCFANRSKPKRQRWVRCWSAWSWPSCTTAVMYGVFPGVI